MPQLGWSRTRGWERHSLGSEERQAPRRGTYSISGALGRLPRRSVTSAEGLGRPGWPLEGMAGQGPARCIKREAG